MKIINAVAFHHTPDQCGTEQLSNAGIIHAANHIVYENSPKTEYIYHCKLDLEYFDKTGKTDNFNIWQNECKSIFFKQEGESK